MEILTKEQYHEYEDFLQNHPEGSFTQSVLWANVKSDWKHEVVVSRNEGGTIVGGMLLLIRSVPFLKYSLLYSPRGPVFSYGDKAVFMDLLEGVKEVGKRYKGYSFIMDPMVLEENHDFIEMVKKLGFQFKPQEKDFQTIQSRHNYMLLDLKNKTPEEVMANFHKKWRYNIRVAQKHLVTCDHYDSSKLPDFYTLYEITAKRDGFKPRPITYFYNLLESLGSYARLYLCYYNNQPVSGAITVQYGTRTCYVYGASDTNHRNVMPNHLMQWHMIQWALENNNDIYDFQGIPVDLSGDSSMHGVYLFKKGFGGQCLLFAGEFHYTLQSLPKKMIDYGMRTMLEVKKIRRNLQTVEIKERLSHKIKKEDQ